VAADSLPPDARAKPILIRALDLMRQVIDEGRDAVRGLRSPVVTPRDLEDSLSGIQKEIAPAGDNVEFRIIVHGDRRPLHPGLRDEVYRIGREALINAFRHARAKRIEVELKYSARRLRVVVRDDGHGMDPAFLQSGREGHWGLPGMRERAGRIGGRLRLVSAPAGTLVELSVPGNVAFGAPAHSRRGWLMRRFVRRMRHHGSAARTAGE
jgi:signal transduction histidine kinase